MTGMDTVVVPVDGSPLSEAALRPGVAIAQRIGARVLVVYADGAPDAPDDIAARLATAVERFGDVVPVVTEAVTGAPADAILDAASGGGLVCMGSHGRSGVRRLVLGSVAEEVVRRSPGSVVLVGPEGPTAPLAGERIRMLVCTDGSEPAVAVVPAAADFAALVGAGCAVTQVIPPDEDVSLDGGPPPQPVREQAEAHVAALAADLRGRGLDADHHLLHGDPARSIEQCAAALPAAFVSVGTAGRSGVARHTMGSVAARLVRHAPCPVLVTRGPDPDEVPVADEDRPAAG